MLRELWFILAFLLVFFGTLCWYLPAEADGRDSYGDRLRPSTIEIEFSIIDNAYDGPINTLEEMIAVHGPIDRIELWCIFVRGSAIMEYVATLDTTSSYGVWVLSSESLPIGIDLGYYLKLFYEDGHMSPSQSAYMFAVTKPPVIEKLNRIR